MAEVVVRDETMAGRAALRRRPGTVRDLSKAIMLAADDRITDAAITRQLRGVRGDR